MSVVLQLPPETQFYQPLARFDADFNAPTAGRYDFVKAANQGVAIQRMRKDRLYLIERYSFSATADEGVYFEAANGGTVPELSLRLPLENNRQIHPDPIPLINYADGLETVVYAYTSQEQSLSGTMTAGSLVQPAGLVGVPEIFIQVQFNIYEVKNKDWIDHFLGLVEGGQAAGLLLPPRGR